MKKILLIHTEYTQTGGEDIAVRKEIEFLAKYFEVETLIFNNTNNLNIKDLMALLKNKNNESIKLLIDKLNKFNPDYIYIHNLWFKASLGILDFVLKNKYKVYLKLHNFRYDCTKSFLASTHLNNKQYCEACGFKKKKFKMFNKYYEDSMAKSVLVNNFGRKYSKILKNNNLNILTLTQHHKDFLVNLGVKREKIFVQPNPVANIKNKKNERKKQIIYAGRISEEKGIIELLNAWKAIETKGYKLIIVGEGPMYSEIETLVKDSNSIELLGYKVNKEVLELIRESKAVVTATKLFEGQPTLLCEASALSTPSIFPDTGGIKDFFPEGYILKFEQYDYKKLSDKLEHVINSEDLDSIGINNQTFITSYLDEDKILASFNSILESK